MKKVGMRSTISKHKQLDNANKLAKTAKRGITANTANIICI